MFLNKLVTERLKIIFPFKCFVSCFVTISLNMKEAAAQGNSLYLPPKEPGYDYPKPGGPSPSPSAPRPQGPSPSKPKTDEVRYVTIKKLLIHNEFY